MQLELVFWLFAACVAGGVALFGGSDMAFWLPLAALLGATLMFVDAPAPPLPRWLLAGWAMLMLGGVAQVVLGLSLTPQGGMLALLAGAMYAAAFALAWRLGAGGAGAARLLRVLSGIAVAVALYGLAMHAAGATHLLWLPKVYYLGDLTGTFVGRNTYATFAGLGVLLCLACALRRLGEARAGAMPKLDWPWLVGAGVLFTSLLLSHSRAGLAVGVLGVGILMAALLWRVRARLFLIGMVAALALLGGAAGVALGGGTLARLNTAGADAQARQAIYAVTAQASLERPWVGSGLGGFAAVFRQHRDFRPGLGAGMDAQVNHAHNSWLQLALELGWPALGLAVGLTLGLAAWFVRGLLRRRRGMVYPALGLASLLLVAAHGLVDFSLNIPGFALFFAALLGLCAVQSLPTGLRQAANARRWPWAVAGLALAVPAAYLSYPAALAWRAEEVLSELKRGQGPSLARQVQAHRQLQRAVGRWPYAPWLGDLALLEMRFAAGTDAAVWQALARQHLRAALVRQPIEPYGWYRLGLLERADRLTAARDVLASMLAGPNEPNLLWARLPLALELAPELEALAPGMVDEQLRAAWVQPKRARAAGLLVR